MPASGFSPSSAASRLAVMAMGYVAAAICAGVTVWLEMQVLRVALRTLGGGREAAAWALEFTRADPGFVGPIIGGLMIIGAVPALIILIWCERAGLRSATVYALSGAVTLPVLAVIGAAFTGGLADLGPGGLLILVALAPLPGLLGGLVYWVIAGHAAGRGWANREETGAARS